MSQITKEISFYYELNNYKPRFDEVYSKSEDQRKTSQFVVDAKSTQNKW
jgi:hypothetical protein